MRSGYGAASVTTGSTAKQNCPDTLALMLPRLEVAANDNDPDDGGMIQEVVLAEALERMEPKAATTFEQRYMPKVRSFAQAGGWPSR